VDNNRDRKWKYVNIKETMSFLKVWQMLYSKDASQQDWLRQNLIKPGRFATRQANI
jgi:hypothetical protein